MNLTITDEKSATRKANLSSVEQLLCPMKIFSQMFNSLWSCNAYGDICVGKYLLGWWLFACRHQAIRPMLTSR